MWFYISFRQIGLVCVFAILPRFCWAQHANHWIFGKNVHLEFTDTNILQQKISNVEDLLEGTATLSDEQGHLLYYASEENYIRNKFHNPIYPRIAINYTSTQAVIILQHSEDSSIYFMTSMRVGTSRWNQLKNDSIILNLQVFAMSGGEKQQAVSHQNQRDIWYANHAQNGDSIYFFLIKKEGLLECPVITHTGLDYYGGDMGWSTQGQMKFSANGKYLAECVTVDPFGVGIYRFNSEYPVTDSIYIFQKGFTFNYTKRWPYGLEFAPDNRSIFIGTETYTMKSPDPQVLYQLVLDSLANDKQGSSWILIDSLNNVDFGALQLAPNGKIYHASPGNTYLGVINNPNAIGSAVNYQRQGLTLDSGGTCLYGLPTFNQSYFYHPAVEFSYEEDCFSNQYSFTAQDSFNATGYQWFFTNVQTGKTEVKSGKSVEYPFTSNGLKTVYEVKLIASNATKADSTSKTLTIRPKLTSNFLGNDTFYCARRSLGEGEQRFKLVLRTPSNMHCVHWMGEEPEAKIDGTIVRGYEHFHSDTYTLDTAGVYFARITNKSFCRAYDTITIEEKPAPPKPEISILSKELVSSVKSAKYRWFLNDTFLKETTVKSINPSVDGYYQVQLISEYGCESTRSDSFLFKNIGIEPLDQLSFKLFPNPSEGLIYVDFGEATTGTISIMDMAGKLVLTQKIRQLHSAELVIKTAGQYILIVVNDEGREGRQVFQVH